jgi:hypothetical protein
MVWRYRGSDRKRKCELHFPLRCGWFSYDRRMTSEIGSPRFQSAASPYDGNIIGDKLAPMRLCLVSDQRAIGAAQVSDDKLSQNNSPQYTDE